MDNNINIIDKEITWDKNLTLVSKTDKFGNIKYCNDAFVNVSGYEEFELVGKPHNIIRHPDMPSVIFKLLWKNLRQGNDFHAVVKNLSKTGRYYWVITQFEIQKDENGEITDYIGRRRAVADEVADTFDKLYFKLKKIEENVSVDSAEDYLIGFLDDRKQTYEEYLQEVLESSNSPYYLEQDTQENLIDGLSKNKSKRSFFLTIFG
jgi:PAS domain S-box-containing protein